ncbi:hypothetical protein PILCRDRAFT_9970 [Piloderma croceum F 1598]|uniref:Uncharacterized protein n=1 Tax=Piloderma croceum (strain F 1598) TaxID=765440 RepID=A0A0C3F4Z6_PILCF|nr:hypothetical protein PILCRDRAFT_9970 [Piloderma croceum F 1598]
MDAWFFLSAPCAVGQSTSSVKVLEREGCETTPELAEGLYTYAEDQAQLQHDLGSKFVAKWEVLHRDGVTEKESDWLATAVEDDELDGAETGSKEEEFYSADDNDADLSDRDPVDNEY